MSPTSQSGEQVIALASPAAGFLEAFLLGNGSLGAAVHGVPGAEVIDLNLDTLWSGGPRREGEPDQDRTAALEPLRAAVRAQAWEEATRLAQQLQGTAYSEAYQPLGSLRWTYASPAALTDYTRSLDLRSAVATVGFRDAGTQVGLTAFVSHPHQVLVVELDGVLPAAAPVLDCPHPTRVRRPPHASEDVDLQLVTGRAPAVSLPLYVGEVPDAVVYADDEPDAEGLVDRGMGFAVAILSQTVAVRTRVLVAAVSGFRGPSERPSADLDALGAAAAALVTAAADLPTEVLRTAHEADHRGLFDRVGLEVRDEAGQVPAAVDYFDLGRYLLIAGSRAGTQPTTLQGIWNVDLRPAWSCNYTTNINTPMNHWPAFSSGLADTALPMVGFVEQLARTGARTARECYAAPGWAAHHNADLWGFPDPVPGQPFFANWPMGGVWLCATLFDLFDFDPDLLSAEQVEAVWAAHVGAAAFALSLLEPYEDGRLVTNPSTSPEHGFIPAPGAPPGIVSAGSAMDQELVHELFEHLAVLAAGRSSLTAEERAVVEAAADALPRLREPIVDDEGRLGEWSEPWTPYERGHRHLSHLHGLYPGSMLTERRDPRLFAAARAALHDRVEHGSGHTGWSQAWILCLAARCGEPELVQHSLDILIGELSSVSGLDLHPYPGEPFDAKFQIDGNLGAVAGILEALVGGDVRDEIVLLRALPPRWVSGRVRGVRVRGGHVVDVRWEAGRLIEASVVAGSDTTLRLVLPGGRTQERAVTCGERLVVGD